MRGIGILSLLLAFMTTQTGCAGEDTQEAGENVQEQVTEEAGDQGAASVETEPVAQEQVPVLERLDESTRRQIFRKIVEAEDRAQEEADQLYETDPTRSSAWQAHLEPNIDESRKRAEEYRTEVREKYGITEDEQSLITREGIEKRWPPL